VPQPNSGHQRVPDESQMCWLWYVGYREEIDTAVPQEQTIAVRWILRLLKAIPLTPWWVRGRRQRNRSEMREHLRRYYAN
jgi:hypothetical protein